MKAILLELERLQSETTLSLAVSNPAQYKANMKAIERLNKKLKKLSK